MYYENTPIDYEPPFFQAARAFDYTSLPVKIDVGTVETPFHQLSLNVKTTVGLVEDDEDEQDDTEEFQTEQNSQALIAAVNSTDDEDDSPIKQSPQQLRSKSTQVAADSFDVRNQLRFYKQFLITNYSFQKQKPIPSNEDLQKKIIRLIERQGSLSIDEIAEKIEGTPMRLIRDSVERLRARGLIVRNSFDKFTINQSTSKKSQSESVFDFPSTSNSASINSSSTSDRYKSTTGTEAATKEKPLKSSKKTGSSDAKKQTSKTLENSKSKIDQTTQIGFIEFEKLSSEMQTLYKRAVEFTMINEAISVMKIKDELCISVRLAKELVQRLEDEKIVSKSKIGKGLNFFLFFQLKSNWIGYIKDAKLMWFKLVKLCYRLVIDQVVIIQQQRQQRNQQAKEAVQLTIKSQSPKIQSFKMINLLQNVLLLVVIE
jgi:Mn-dependent DtxR family transcriptional regulator